MTESMHDILFNSHRTEIQEIEKIGEMDLRYKLANNTFTGNRKLAEEWLKLQDQSRRDERETRMLKIAESARTDARSARIAAIISATIAAAATIISTVIKINSS